MKIISNRKLQELIGWKPHVNQREILKSDKREIVIAAGRGFGKSATSAYIALKELLKDDKQILIIAPTYDLTHRVLKYIEAWTSVGFPSIRNKISYRPTPHIKTEWGSSIECRSAEKPVGILGERYDLVIVDEAAKISRKTWEIYIYPTTQIKGGKIIYISTPWGENWFHETWVRTKGFKFRSLDNPYFKEKDWEHAKKVLPEAVFQQEYEAMFLPDAAAVFRGIDLIIKEDALSDVITGHRYVMGVDLGKHQDFTVLTVIDKWNNNVVYFDRFNKIDYPFQKKRIIATAKRYNNARIIVDSSIDGDCKLFWRENGILKYGTFKELHQEYKDKKKIEVLSLIDRANKKMRTVSNTGYPSIENSGIGWMPIKASINHGFQDVYEVELKNGRRINATASHSFFRSPGFKSSLELATIHNTDSLIGVSKEIEGKERNTDFRFITFLGLWVADGSFNKTSNTVAISTGRDKKVISFIKEVNPHFKDYGKKGDYVVCNKEFKNKIIKLGVKNRWRSYTKRVPKWLFTASKKEVSSFLKGYFSGDGCVYLHKGKPVISSSSVNYDLSADIQVLLYRLGIRSVVGKGTKNKLSQNLQYSLTVEWRKSVRKFKENIGFINKEIPNVEGSKGKNQKSALQRIGIRKVRYLGKKEVYDLSVPNTESFVAEGILCHNTGVGEPIKDDLERSGLFIDDYVFSGKSKKELVEKLSIFIENKYIWIPNIKTLIDELKVFGYEMTEKGNITYTAPQGLHDDSVMSLGLAVWGLIGRSNPTTAIHEELTRVSKKKTKFQYK